MTNLDNLDRLWESRRRERELEQELERRSIERRWHAKHEEFNATRRNRGLGEVEFAVFKEFAKFNSGRRLNGLGEIEFEEFAKPDPDAPEAEDSAVECRLCDSAEDCEERSGCDATICRDHRVECVGCGSTICDACRTDSEAADEPTCPACLERMEQEDRGAEQEEESVAEEQFPSTPVKVSRSPMRHVRLGIGLDEALRAESERSGALASEIVRRALRAYLG